VNKVNIANEVRKIADEGKFFKVTFIKKDGTVREMTCRSKVHKYVKGTGKPISDGRISLYEMAADGEGADKYRSMWPSTIKRLKCGDKVIENDPYCPIEMKPRSKK